MIYGLVFLGFSCIAAIVAVYAWPGNSDTEKKT